jgi:phage portal protein BeeE
VNRLQTLLRSVNEGYLFGGDSALINGALYPLMGTQTLGGKVENIDYEFTSYVMRGFMGNPIVFACEMARVNLFTEARFQFQKMTKGRPGDYYGDRGQANSGLSLLDHPWPGGTTGDLLKYLLTDADFSGNSFTVRTRRDRLFRARPDWTTMIHGSPNPDTNMWDPEAEFLGIAYQPGGPQYGREPIFYDASMVAHFSPIPDPLLPLRGMSWLTPVIREVMGDQAMSEHKLRFFEQGATPNVIVKTTFTDVAKAKEWINLWRQEHEGVQNAYKTMFLSAGADADVVGANLQQVDFSSVQGHGETRIASAAGVPPVVAGLSEGLQGSSLNSGNFQASMRRFADLTMRPLWRNCAGSFERIIPPPSGSRLWYDARDIPALKDDIKDMAEVQLKEAQSIRSLLDAGFVAESVIKAVIANDMSLLQHSGLFSVQLQAPGSTKMPQGEVPGELPIGTAPVGDVKPPPTNGSKPPVPTGAS